MKSEMNYDELMLRMDQFLKSKSYSKLRQKQLKSKWRKLQEFLQEKGYIDYRPLYGLEYLHETINYPDLLERKLTPDERDEIRSVRFLNQYLEDQTVPRVFRRKRKKWNDENDEIREAYERHYDFVNTS